MAVLIGRQLDVGDRREITVLHRGVEILRSYWWFAGSAACRRFRCSRSTSPAGRAWVGLAVEAKYWNQLWCGT